jgi:hypothetical protein
MCCGRGSRTATTPAGTPAAAPARVAQPAAEQSWTVTMPDSSTRTVRSEVAAKLIVGANPGAVYARS